MPGAALRALREPSRAVLTTASGGGARLSDSHARRGAKRKKHAAEGRVRWNLIFRKGKTGKSVRLQIHRHSHTNEKTEKSAAAAWRGGRARRSSAPFQTGLIFCDEHVFKYTVTTYKYEWVFKYITCNLMDII